MVEGAAVEGRVVGESAMGLTVVGANVVGFPVVGKRVVGLSGVGESVAGLSVVTELVGRSVAGLPVVGELDIGPRLMDGAVDRAASDGEALLGTAVHASTLHTADSNGVGQACATPAAVTEATTPRILKYDPPSYDPPRHATEHVLQPVQSPTLQSVHTIAEQAILLDRVGHKAPPPYAISLTERQR